MANYVPYWRTNYFQVKDEDEFKAWASSIVGDYRVIQNSDGWFAIISEGEIGLPDIRHPSRDEAQDMLVNQPDEYYDDAFDDETNIRMLTEDDIEFDFLAELGSHLADSCVAACIEIGLEKMRYLIGQAVVVDSSGEVVGIELNNWIHATAKEKWPGKGCTKVMY